MRGGRTRRAVRWRGRAGRVAVVGLLLALGAACGGGGSGEDGPITLSGRIAAPGGTAIDSDVNDSLALYASNDAPPDAQELPTPVAVGGYLNVAGSGPSGRSQLGGDPRDIFRVALVANQVIRLFVAETVGPGTDLDLRLLNAAGDTLIQESATLSQVEQITVPSSGNFLIEVAVTAGYSNYVLTVGQTPSAATRAFVPEARPLPELVPGEVVVRYRDDRLGPSAARSPDQLAASVGMRHRAGRRGGPMLFACRDERDRHEAFRALGIAHLWRGHDPTDAALAEERLRQDTLRLAKALASRPDVESAAPNYVRRATAVPQDEFYPFQWHYESLNLPQAWDAASNDSGVIVAVLDTGILFHPDFTGQLVNGYDFVSNPTMAGDGDGCDPNETDPGDLGVPGGSSWHGTHVAGTVAARTSFSAGNTEGVAGVAWNARIMPLRVLGVGGGTDFDIMEAIRYAAGLANNCGATPASTARIVSMSLGGAGRSQPFQDLVTQLRASHDMIFVAAAGNDASSVPSYPAAYDGVISVSATGPENGLAPYSNFGSTIDVAAPGGDLSRDVNGDGFGDGVLSTYYDESTGQYIYAFLQGTSMATPHVAGVIALMLDQNPNLTPDDIDRLLTAGMLTRDIGSSTFFGAGLIDAVKAVNAAANETGGGPVVTNPLLRVDPDMLNFGILADAFQVTATNGGSGADPNVTAISFTSTPGGWLQIAPDAVDPATGLGTYRVSVDRSGLADGLYLGTLLFESDANDVAVPILMQVGDVAAAQPNAGHHYVLLAQEQDDGSFDTIDEFRADPVNGVYSFAFHDVEPGSYFLFAGSDSDNDRFICDPGEACGAYPTLDNLSPLDVTRSRTDLDFDTGFEAGIGASAAGATGAGIRLPPEPLRRALP